MTILQPLFYFWTAERIFLGRLVIKNPILKYLVQLFWLLPILFTVMATFGWCSTEKPALFTWPSRLG